MGEVDFARDALEYLEGMAHQGVGAPEFIEMLQRTSGYSPAWDSERAAEAMISLQESRGNYEQAAVQLETIGHRLLAVADEHSLDDVLLIANHLEGLGTAGEPGAARLRDVAEARLAQLDAGVDDELVEDGPDVRILVVGGDERQRRMDKEIADRVSRELRGVSVEFLHTGWSGNWTAHAEEVMRRMNACDGVVLLTMMRTTLGWTIRARCHLPWRGCSGRGQGAIFEAISRVIPWAKERRSQVPVHPPSAVRAKQE